MRVQVPPRPPNRRVKSTMSENESKDVTEATDDLVGAAIVDADEVDAREEAEQEFEFVEDPTFGIDYKGDCAYEVKVTVPAAKSINLILPLSSAMATIFPSLLRAVAVTALSALGSSALRKLSCRFHSLTVR